MRFIADIPNGCSVVIRVANNEADVQLKGDGTSAPWVAPDQSNSDVARAIVDTCREWLRGCSCAETGRPEQCKECTVAFRQGIQKIFSREEPPRTAGYVIHDSIDCSQYSSPFAVFLWKETDGGTHWGYGLVDAIGDEHDSLVVGFETEDAARNAAMADVRERMAP